ncbi:ABC transporter permease [Thaumasiovibrio subtropicus]|uniref:ABC transporter permease n=1 Tax=Thaumasiovibrio subtropicus TaxID=1891207 RepID=UPI000B35F990|nr:ABC transporter permease [Thaumasiovibrio subtropicus]
MASNNVSVTQHSSRLLSLMKQHALLIAFVALVLIIAVFTPNFLSSANLINVLRQSAIVGLIAIGSTFVITGGGFDISVGSILALSAALVLGFQAWMPWQLAVPVVIAIGAMIGMINGILTAKIGIVAIITTLGTMTILRGVTYIYTGGYPIVGESEAFRVLGSGYIGPIPVPVLLFILMVALGQFVLSRTKLGRYTCAVGGNKESARLSGVPVDFYQIMTFVIGGAMAAMAGIIYASRLNSATPLAGQGYELDAIAATVIGGTSVAGGRGSVIGTLIGVLLLTVVNNMFNLLGVPVYIQYVIKGVIILTVVGVDAYHRREKY